MKGGCFSLNVQNTWGKIKVPYIDCWGKHFNIINFIVKLFYFENQDIIDIRYALIPNIK